MYHLAHSVVRVVCFFSSRPNWDPQPPHPQASVSTLSPFGSLGGDTLACRKGGGRSQFGRGTDTVSQLRPSHLCLRLPSCFYVLCICSFFPVSSVLRALFSSDLWGSCDESAERRVLRHLLTLHFGLILADFWPQLLNEDVLFELR